MDSKIVEELADRVFSLLREYGIDCRRLGMSVTLSREAYNRIKENFPDRPAIDLGIVQTNVESGRINVHEEIPGHTWTINIISEITPSIDNQVQK